MARRRQSSNTQWIILAAGVFAAVLVSLIFFRNEAYSTTPELQVRDYLANANSLRGNVYRVQGEVEGSLAWSPTMGRLISINVGEDGVLPVLVTKKFDGVNIQKGQKFIFLLEVNPDGILTTKNLTKA